MTNKQIRTFFFTLCLMACFFLPSVSVRAASTLENGTKNCLELLNSLHNEDPDLFTSLEPHERERMELTQEQYQIISDYTKELTKYYEKAADKIEAVVYFARNGQAVEEAPACPAGMNPNSPYAVFRNRYRVTCQGYANLCRTMLASLDIPCVIAHGYLQVYDKPSQTETSQGHAWNYVCYDGGWVLADAAQRNGCMSNLSEISKLYTTTDIEQTIYTENGLEFSFCEGVLGVIGYSGESRELIVPESCHGRPVASVSPMFFYAGHPLQSSSIEKIVLPKSVEYGILSTQLDSSGNELQELRSFQSPSLKEIEVAEDNPVYGSYKGILYDKSFSRILSIPQALTDVELKPLKDLDKDTFGNLSNPRTIKIGEGTETIGIYTFNYFTSLESVYIPASVTKIDDQAFNQCNTDFTIYAPEGSAGAGFAASKGLACKDPAAPEPPDDTGGDEAPKKDPAPQDPAPNPPVTDKVPTLKKVAGLRVSYKKSGKAVLTWKKVKGASGYEIRRLRNGRWVKVKTLKKTKLSIIRNAKKTYQYKVRAYKKSGKKMYYGTYSKKIKIRKK